MMTESGLVSIIIPAYNQGHYLGKAIQSGLDQTYPHHEVIVVDDGSQDNTAQVARGYSDPRVRYAYQENHGLSGARNTGMRLAKGEYLTFLDSDDGFLPDKLALLVAELEAHPQTGFTAGQALLIDEHGQRIGRSFDSRLPERPEELLLGNPFHVGSVMLRRSWQEKTGFFDEGLRSYEDWDYWLRLAVLKCPMRVIEKPVSLYRFHTAQMTRNGAQMTAASMAVLAKLFARPDLPPEWQALKSRAYSQAYLRATAHGFLASDYPLAHANLKKAIEFNPDLVENDAAALSRQFSAWIELPKTRDGLSFLENIYNHLPEDLAFLRRNRRRALSQAAVKWAFEAYQAGDYRNSRKAAWRAICYRPAWLGNRGVFSLFFKSLFPTLIK